ncbi:MAG: ABC transporter permease [Bacteroidetes bacterium]|nr:ABC transporter permease [Bacteroidota bacterium]
MVKSTLLQLISIQFKEFLREPGIIFWALLFPILMAWVLGIAFTKKGEVVRQVALIENIDSTNINLRDFLSDPQIKVLKSGEHQQTFTSVIENTKLGNTTYKFLITSWDAAELMLKRGKIAVILVEHEENVEFHFDPSNPESQSVYLQLSAVFNDASFIYETSTIRPLTKAGTRYIDFLVPGLIALGIMNSCMWGISYALIDMRSKKLLRRMVATPMKKSTFLIAQFSTRVVMSFVESALLFTFAFYIFKVDLQGSFIALLAVFVAGNIAFSGLAILVSSRTAHSRVGNGLINAVVMPMMILSGIFFSYHNFPDWSVDVIQKLPLTMLADSVRSIFNEGAGLSDVLFEAGMLSAIGILFYSVGLWIYKWY